MWKKKNIYRSPGIGELLGTQWIFFPLFKGLSIRELIWNQEEGNGQSFCSGSMTS